MACQTQLAFLLLATCLFSTLLVPAQSQSTLSVPDTAQAAIPQDTTVPVDSMPSAYAVSHPRRRGRFAALPTAKAVKERHAMLSSLPDLQPMSSIEMQATFQGDSAPGTKAGSDSIPGDVQPQANGVAGAAYADSRFGTGEDYTSLAARRVGKLLVRSGGVWYTCSAAVINRALLLTAAHCLCDYGKGAACFPDKVNGQLQVLFQPGTVNNTKPFGEWTAAGVLVLSPFSEGRDSGDGVAVSNDVALVWLNPLNGSQIGDVTGYFGYSFNGYSFAAPVAGYGVPTAPATSMLTQFGYPMDFDQGRVMQISNAATYTMKSSMSNLKNIIRGSSMTGGSSGGPWIANYGTDAQLAAGITYGNNANRNVIVGVTSWGYDVDTYKVMGSSFFGANAHFPSTYGTRGAGNIGKLMFDACDNTAITAWSLKAKGLCI